jgi:hypothetical protein
MAALGWLALLSTTVQAGPIINDNFTADMIVTRFDAHPQALVQHYTWDEWFTGHLRRIDVTDTDDGSVDQQVFQFLPDHPLSTCNGTALTIPMRGKHGVEYRYNVPQDKCSQRAIALRRPAFFPVPHSNTMGFWDVFTQPEAFNAGACFSTIGNHAGTLWTYPFPQPNRYVNVSVCVASDNNTPYWVAWQGTSPACPRQNQQGAPATCTLIEAVFATFTAGVPDINTFCPSPEAMTACGLTPDDTDDDVRE